MGVVGDVARRLEMTSSAVLLGLSTMFLSLLAAWEAVAEPPAAAPASRRELVFKRDGVVSRTFTFPAATR